MGERNFSRAGKAATSSQGHGGNCVMRAPEGAVLKEGVAAVCHPGHGPDFSSLQSFSAGHIGQN